MLVPDDKEEDKAIITYFLNSAYRTESDLYFFASPQQFTQIIRDPIPPLKTLIDFENLFLNAIPRLLEGNDELKNGIHRGDSNIGRKFRAAFPIINQPDKLLNMANIQMNNSSYYR